MKTVMLVDPATTSLNIGDHIISDSCDRELSPLLDESFVVRVSSHLPVSRYLSYIDKIDYRFVCGSNLLRGRMNARFRQWDITPRYSHLLRPSVLLGVGWWQYGDDLNAYTRWLYRRILSREYLHSVRDQYTAEKLRSMGMRNVINTSCPTMWRLTEQHCDGISTAIGDTVITTVTDYAQDPTRDRSMLMRLADMYPTVRVWLQGAGDAEYLEKLELPRGRFDMIGPKLEQFDAALQTTSVDYVGTRLHAGIRALQHGRRSLIIGVDNRAAEKNRDFNLPWLPRENIEDLAATQRAGVAVRIRIPESAIRMWKAQFPELGVSESDCQ